MVTYNLCHRKASGIVYEISEDDKNIWSRDALLNSENGILKLHTTFLSLEKVTMHSGQDINN
jgi:hypothetical protein